VTAIYGFSSYYTCCPIFGDYFINRPGKPIDNRHIESFNGRLRDECLNVNWFMSLEHAREIIGQWREDYNSIRPHSSLGALTPEEFLVQQTEFCQKEVVG